MTREMTPIPQQDTATAVEVIRTLVQAQNIREAKNELRQLKSAIDDPTWLLLTEIANTLRFKTHDTAVAKLRNLWQRNEPYRDIIEACVPKQGEGQYIRKAARQKRPPPDEVRPKPGNLTESYEDDLGKTERDDPGTPRPKPITDRHDYDIDAALEVRSGLCVSCRLERAEMDTLTGRVLTGHGDDGLCYDCRDSGRAGIPELPLGHVPVDAVLARLDFLADSFGTKDRGIYRQEWRNSLLPAEKGIIGHWVKAQTSAANEAASVVETPTVAVMAHTEPDQQAGPVAETPTVDDPNGDCAKCGEWRQLRDTLCHDCHPKFGGEETVVGSPLPERPLDSVADRRASRKTEHGNNETPTDTTAATAATADAGRDGGPEQTRQKTGRAERPPASKRQTAKKQKTAASEPGTGSPGVTLDEPRRIQRRQPSPRPQRAGRLR